VRAGERELPEQFAGNVAECNVENKNRVAHPGMAPLLCARLILGTNSSSNILLSVAFVSPPWAWSSVLKWLLWWM
jgi:hypothetical protein